jgi:hypothetical protein
MSDTAEIVTDWQQRAKVIFNVPKPEHFTDHRHCCECAEHDQTLLAHDVDSISVEELGHPGWDPLCFTSAEGLLYYLPALIRLTLETIDNREETYLEQMLFHLTYGGAENRIWQACNREQRGFVAEFIRYLISSHSARLEECGCGSEIEKALEVWQGGAPYNN